MNLPNKLTVTRIVLAPLLFVAYWLPSWTGGRFANASVIVVLILFVMSEATDLADGLLARKLNLVTDLGKIMDPFADTFSRLTYFVCLSGSGIMPLWSFIIIMWREFSMIFIRMLMMGKGVAVAANIWGKSKAVLYAVSASLGFLYVALLHWMGPIPFLERAQVLLSVVFTLAAVASVASFSTYIKAIVKEGTLSDMSR